MSQILTEAEIINIAAQVASNSLKITRFHELGGPTRTTMEEAGVVELGRAIESAVLAKIATTPAASPIPIDAPALAQKLRELATGRVEWRVQDPVTKAFCMSFSHADSSHPKREAIEWLANFAADFPGHPHAKYEVAEVKVFTELEQTALQAADALAASTTPEPSPLVVPRWISVEDQMPELGVEVLVFKPGHRWGEVQFDTWNDQHEAPLSFSSATIPIGPGWDNEDDFYAITHWMPIPAAPVQVKGEA